MTRNSQIILSKGIKLDRKYKQVLSYSESNMISLLTDSSHIVARQLNYNFIRERGTIKVSIPYATCLQANYLAFQNTDYSNKWFFAFIDEVKYLSENSTEIYYTVDIWSTWFDYWNPKSCYVIRQHVTDDTVGANTIPEGLEHGEYVGSTLTNMNYIEDDFQDCYMMLNVALAFDDSTVGVVNVGNTYVTGYLYATENPIVFQAMATASIGVEGGQILGAYLIPKSLIPSSALTAVSALGGIYYRVGSWPDTTTAIHSIMSRSNLDLDGYTPVNNKLLTYPYCFCLMTNNAGASNMLKFEDFLNGNISVRYYGVPTMGGSIMAIPTGYKNITYNYAEGLIAGKYPTLGWSEDAYTNWLTQNAVNITGNNIKAGIQAGLGIASIIGGVALSSSGVGATVGAGLISSGAGMVVDGGVTAFQGFMADKEHQMEPDSYKGNINGGDVLTAIGYNTFIYRAMTIKNEYARKLDKFFTRYGYKVNDITVPNMLHRQNYNYIQIDKDSTTAFTNNHNNISVPASSMEIINNLFRSGITVWNNHNNFGDYSVSNGITS